MGASGSVSQCGAYASASSFFTNPSQGRSCLYNCIAFLSRKRMRLTAKYVASGAQFSTTGNATYDASAEE
jgi:hypothetical protein